LVVKVKENDEGKARHKEIFSFIYFSFTQWDRYRRGREKLKLNPRGPSFLYPFLCQLFSFLFKKKMAERKR